MAGGSGGGGQQSAQPPSSGSTPQVPNLKAAPAPQEPSTLTVGGSGELGSGTYYVSGTNTAIGSLSETYSITDNSSSNLILITNSSGAVNGSSVNETITYFVDSSGAVALDGVQLIVNGTELSFGTDPWSY